jgi:plasmid segregation protein ParM
MSKTILAVDIGYGNTKVVWGPSRDASCEIHFRSIAPVTMQKSSSMQGLAGMDRVGIFVDGMQYLVGPEAFEAGGVATLDTNFSGRPQYLALLRGAIYYMIRKSGVSRHKIDGLVLGLPVSNFGEHKDALTKLALGVHTIPTPPGLTSLHGSTIDVNIDKVMVLPQPLGALRTHAGQVNAIADADSANLMVDAGYNTFDWMVARGMRSDLERSGSFEGGVAHVLRSVSNQAAKNLGVGSLDLTECELALEKGDVVVNARRYEFSGYRAIAETAADEIVDRFVNALDRTRRFDRIILTGGGAKFYVNALRKHFPDHNILAEKESMMANARGFYLFARGLLE